MTKKTQILIILMLFLFFFSCKKEPEACFTVENQDVFLLDTVYFRNCSVNAESYFWDFGDDSVSAEENPIHIYKVLNEIPTIYTVKLMVRKDDGIDVTSKQITVHHWGENIEGDYKGTKKIIFNNDTISQDTVISSSLSLADYLLYWNGLALKAFGKVTSKYDFEIQIHTDLDCVLNGQGKLTDDSLFIDAENKPGNIKIIFEGKKIQL